MICEPLPDPELNIVTARLRLTPLVQADADVLFTVLDDPGLHRFIGGEPPGLAQLRARFARWQQRVSPDGTQLWLNWTVRLIDGDTAVGYVQATVIGGEAAVAYVVGSAWSGMGIATEAVAAMCTFLCARLMVRQLVASIHPAHAASAAVARHAGLTATGTLDGDGEELWVRTIQP